MGDLKNTTLIYAKGWLFLLCGFVATGLLLLESPSLETAALIGIAIWSFCRFYYFAFYVIQHYVDDAYRFAGLWDFILWWANPRNERSE